MKKRIFLYYMLLVIVGLTFAGFFISELAQKLYKQEVEEELTNISALVKSRIVDDRANNIPIDFDSFAKKHARLLNQTTSPSAQAEKKSIRITFIDFKGNVIGESEKDYHTMENHLQRKEIQQAMRGEIGQDVRHSQTLNIDFLYLSMPVENSSIIIRLSTPLMKLENIDRIIWYYTIIGILGGVVLTAILALRFSSSLVKPVVELTSLSKQISMGNYSKRLNIKSKDELGQLAETFNEMAAKLEITVADLTDKNVKFDSIMNSMINGIVAVDKNRRIILINAMAREIFGIKKEEGAIGSNILELIRNNQINVLIKDAMEKNTSLVNEVTIALPDEKVLRVYTNPIKPKVSSNGNNDEIWGGIIFIQDITNIRKLEQIRTEFVSNVTHELKTPLTSIRGFVETLRSGAINDTNVSEKFLEIIDIEAERLYMLINDILQLSEIETMQKDSNIGIYDLKEVTDEVLSILNGMAEKKNISLISTVDDNLIIHANRDRIKQMLINLIDNGIKYSCENGSVAVSACRANGKIVISIKDNGIGIAKEHLPRIFERFYRVDKGRSRNMGGTGLGLSIVKHIVNLYNGDIRVTSEPGKGTEFIIRLPA